MNCQQTSGEQNTEAHFCVLLGVFNDAETRRQFHTGHNAESEIAVNVFLSSIINNI